MADRIHHPNQIPPDRPPGSQSLTRRNDLDKPNPVWWARLGIALLAALILGGLARFILIPRIPGEQYFYRELSYKIDFSEPGEQRRILWETFAQQQETKIRKLADSYLPDRADQLTLNITSITDPRIVLSLPCKGDTETIDPSFQRFIDEYHQYRKKTEAEQTTLADSDPSSQTPTDLINRAERKTQVYEKTMQELLLLRSEYARLEAESVAIEHQFLSAPPSDISENYQTFLQPYLQQTIEDDIDYQQTERRIEQLSRQLAELDLQRGQSQTVEELHKLNQQRNRIYRDRIHQKEHLRLRREHIEDNLILKYWEEYQTHLKTEIKKKQQAMIANSDRQLSLRGELERLSPQNQTESTVIAPTSASLLPNSPPKTDAERINVSADADSALRPILLPSDQPFVLRRRYTGRHYVILILTSLAGAVLGWFLSTLRPGQTQRRAVAHEKKPSDVPESPPDIPIPAEPIPASPLPPSSDATEDEDIFADESTVKQDEPDTDLSELITIPAAENAPPDRASGEISTETDLALSSELEDSGDRPKKTVSETLEPNADKLPDETTEPPAQPEDILKPLPEKSMDEIPSGPIEKPPVEDVDRSFKEATPIQTEPKPSESEVVQASPDTEKAKEASAAPAWTQVCEKITQAVDQLRGQIGPPVILLGSPSSEEASPRAAVNLAISLVQSLSLKVLLIEVDQDRHDLAAVFDLDGDFGFYDWRRGDLWTSQTIKPTTLLGLSFMPSGVPSEQQCDPQYDLSREMHRWNNLRQNYDAILLYCPTVLSVTAENEPPARTATVCLLDLADVVLVLIDPEQHSAPDVQDHVNSLLEGHQAQFWGAIPVSL